MDRSFPSPGGCASRMVRPEPGNGRLLSSGTTSGRRPENGTDRLMADVKLGGEGTETLRPGEHPDRRLLRRRQLAGTGTIAATNSFVRMRAIGEPRNVVSLGPKVGDRNSDPSRPEDRRRCTDPRRFRPHIDSSSSLTANTKLNGRKSGRGTTATAVPLLITRLTGTTAPLDRVVTGATGWTILEPTIRANSAWMKRSPGLARAM